MNNWIKVILLSILSGLLLTASLPETLPYWFGGNAGDLATISGLFAWVALVPLLLCITTFATTAQATFGTYIAAIIYTTTVYRAISIFDTLPWLLLANLYALYITAWGFLSSLAIKKLSTTRGKIFIPALFWLIYELMRASGTMKVNWGSLVYTQYKFTPLLQILPFVGSLGLLLLILLFNSTLTYAISSYMKEHKIDFKQLLPNLAVISVVILVAIYGTIKINLDAKAAASAQKFKVSVLQPSINADEKLDPNHFAEHISKLFRMTQTAKLDSPELILWPETSYPALLPKDKIGVRNLELLEKIVSTPIILGSISIGDNNKFYNRAFHIGADGTLDSNHYSKRALVPFGEYLPLPEWMHKYPIFSRVQNFVPGDKVCIFNIGGVPVGMLLCFDSDFTKFTADNIKAGAKFIAVLSNDGWFGQFPVPTHHITWNVFRAAEHHVNFVQAANTGICAIIDYNGKIVKHTSVSKEDILTGEIALLPAGTPYSYHHNLITAIILILTFLAALPTEKFRMYISKKWR